MLRAGQTISSHFGRARLMPSQLERLGRSLALQWVGPGRGQDPGNKLQKRRSAPTASLGTGRHAMNKSLSPIVSRRAFVQSSAALLTAATYSRVLGANERIGIGFIGYGLIGKRHVI